MKGMSAKDIHNDMKGTLGGNCISYSTVCKYLREKSFNSASSMNNNISNLNNDQNIDIRILEVLDKEPYASIRQIAKITGIPNTTVYRHLIEILGYQNKLLKWVPHILTVEIKKQRVDKSMQLLKILQSAKHRSFKYFVTGDESWFEYDYYHVRQWIPLTAPRGIRCKKIISQKKVMLTVFWNPHGFAVIDFLPKEQTFNSQYYVSNILLELSKKNGENSKRVKRKLVVHADNAKPHTSRFTTLFMESNKLKIAPHPPYSPDIAPSDFFLFGYVKGKMEGCHFESRDEVIEKVTSILLNIPHETLQCVFEEWEARLKKDIKINGEYI